LANENKGWIELRSHGKAEHYVPTCIR